MLSSLINIPKYIEGRKNDLIWSEQFEPFRTGQQHIYQKRLEQMVEPSLYNDSIAHIYFVLILMLLVNLKHKTILLKQFFIYLTGH